MTYVWTADRNAPHYHVVGTIHDASRVSPICRPTRWGGTMTRPVLGDEPPAGLTPCPKCDYGKTLPARGTPVVYAMQCENAVKVGFSRDLAFRALTLGGRVLCWRRGGSFALEDAIHGRLQSLAASPSVRRTEWYRSDCIDQVVRAVLATEAVA